MTWADLHPNETEVVLTVPPGVAPIRSVLLTANIITPIAGFLRVSVIAPNGQIAVLPRISGAAWSVSGYDLSSSFPADTGSGDWKLRVVNVVLPGTISSFSLAITSTYSATVFTAPGANKPTSPGAPSAGSSRRDMVGEASCTTCDQLPVNTDADIQAKLKCLDDNLTTAVGPLQSSLVARMKLLFQLAGERLTAAQRTRIEAVYTSSDAGAACSTPLVWDSACQTEAAALALPSQLQLCQDLITNDKTSKALAIAELPHCLDQLAKTAQLPADSCRIATRDVADGVAQAVITKTYPPLTGDLTTLLPPILSELAGWSTAATTAAAGDRGWLLGHGNTLLRQLWANIENAKLGLPSAPLGDLSLAVKLLSDITGTGFTDDFAVLSAVFAPQQSAVSPLLFELAGDALQPIADRLTRLEAFHDVGCRFSTCRTVSSTGVVTLRASAMSELVHALAVLPDHDALAAALPTSGKLATQQPALYSALTRVRDQHAYLETAWAALGRSEPFSQLATIMDPPAEISALAAIVRTAGVAWSSYQGSGEFTPWHTARLTVATLEQSALVGFIDGLRSTMTTARTNYENSRLNTVNDLLNQSHSNATVQSASDRLSVLRDQDSDLMSRSLGLEAREADERAAIAGFQAAFEALINSGALDENAAYQIDTLPSVRVSAADAKYPGIPFPGDVARDRITGATVTLNPGDSLRLAVTGSWTPTCAVLSSQIPNTREGFEAIRVSDAQTGPEGYWLSRENDVFSANSTSNSTEWRDDYGTSEKTCAGISISYSGAGASWEDCDFDNHDVITSNTLTGSSGGSTRTTASFATGIRLPNTPFPTAPTGSLVAVLTRTNHPETVFDVRVVLRNDLIVAPAGLQPGDQIDVSFVVNDLGTCGGSAASQLQIDAVRSRPVGTTAQAVGAAMAATLQAMEAQAPTIMAEGQLTSDEGNALRAGGWKTVDHSLPDGIGLAGLPYDLRQLFDSFLEREIASIGRRSQMHAIARERLQLKLSAVGVANELSFADAQDRLLMLIPRWRLRDLSGVALAQSVEALAEAMSTYVAQVYELRDPAAATLFRSTEVTQLDALKDLNLTAAYADSAPTSAVQAFDDFVSAARNALASAQFELPTQFRRTLVVAVPAKPLTCPVGAPCIYKNMWTAVSNSTAAAFWAATQASPFGANITLTPSDLYSALGTGTLACGDVAPVVRRMAIYLDTNIDPRVLSSTFLNIEGTAAASGASAVFPLTTGPLSIDADSPAGVAVSVPALNGAVNAVDTRFGPSVETLGPGAGLSPFTTFHFDMTPFQSGIPKALLGVADAVLLVFEVERRVSTDRVQLPGVCTAAGN